MLPVQIDSDNTDGLKIVFKLRYPTLVVSSSINSRIPRSEEPCELRSSLRSYESPNENLLRTPELVQSRSLTSAADLADWDVSGQHTKVTHR